jgi:hypothetical protein
MAELRGGDKIKRWLAAMGNKVSRNEVLQVGFMENATYENGTQVALVAVVQDFGAPSRGIPPRPFFRNAIANGKGTWPGVAKQLLKANDFDARKAFTALGVVIEGDIKASILGDGFIPLKPATIKRKGFDRQLVDTGHMLSSVTSRIVEK